MATNKRITITLTPLQVAAAAEAVDHYAMFVDIPARQRKPTERVAALLNKAFEKSGEFWPL